MTLSTDPDASFAIVDLLDAMASYRTEGDTDVIHWVSACLLRIAGEESFPDSVRLLATQLYEETCIQAATLSGHSLRAWNAST